nr:hypothetical protein [Curtobacterium pusillum]
MERFGEMALHLGVFIDVEPDEKGLVELPANDVASAAVGLVAVLGQEESRLQVGCDILGRRVGSTDAVFQGSVKDRDAPLLLGVQLGRNDSGKVTFEQLPSAVVEAGQLLQVPRPRSSGLRADGCCLFAQDLGGLRSHLRSKDDSAVVQRNFLFDQRDPHRRPGTRGALGMPTGANEVLVERAVPVAGQLDDEPAFAAAAEHRASQVAGVVPALLPDRAGREDVLNPLPNGFWDQGIVAAGSFSSSPANDALVVGIGEHLVQLRAINGSRWS